MTHAVLTATTVVTVLLLASVARADGRTARPYEAPLFDETPVLPPLPAEYLKHDQTGVRFAYHPSARERVRALIEESDAIRSALSVTLGEPVLSSIDVRVAVGSSDFERVVPPGTPEGAGSVAISQARLLVLALRSGPTSASEVGAAFRRGLAYLALDEIAGYQHLPRWLRIGFALHFSGEGAMARSRALWWASLERRVLPLDELDHHLAARDDDESVAAAEAADFVRFLLEEERRDGWPQLLHASRDQPWADAVAVAFQSSADELESAWREDLARHRAFLPILGGGVGVWALVAAGVLWRRRRRGKGDGRKAVGEPERRTPKPKMVRMGKGKRRRASATHIPEPEVPKVAHNGRWHTLH